MKNNLKKSIIMFIGAFLCLAGFIGCDIDISSSSNNNGWSYVNILDTKSQTFLCCTSS